MFTKLKDNIKTLLHNMQSNIKRKNIIAKHGFPIYREAQTSEFKSLRAFLDFLPTSKSLNKEVP